LCVRPNEGVITDHCPVFIHSIVITSDGASTNIDSRTNIGIPKVREMTGFGVLAKSSIFNFNKITDVHASTECSARAQPSIRSDLRFITHDGLLQMAEGLDPG
jgi:hypothetical protein